MDERSTRNTAKRNSPICILKAENELRAPPTTEKERKTLAKYYGVLDGGCNLTNREMGKKMDRVSHAEVVQRTACWSKGDIMATELSRRVILPFFPVPFYIFLLFFVLSRRPSHT